MTSHLSRAEIEAQDDLARAIADAVTAYLAETEARVAPRIILNALEDARSDLGLNGKEAAE